ncbi:MAG TPA: Asp-tRNA(Asn)/Glu-tRNA(Gln) amidotransferase GatCAB subunit B, partial [Firmicutes bacterium]|nr:Asp-tRNA(Asn)/Glu-tRNA(Gln) amidotransferase GatCAB subunit B [Bacillota bacterium]
DQKVINGKIAKMVFEEMFYTGKKPEAIVAEKDLEQVSDPKVIKEIVAR